MDREESYKGKSEFYWPDKIFNDTNKENNEENQQSITTQGPRSTF